MIKNKIGVGTFIAIAFLVSITFAPAVSAKAETQWCNQVLNSNEIIFNKLDTNLTKYEKVGNQIQYGGTFEFDVEKKVGNQLKRLKSSGTFTGTIYPDSSSFMEYNGDNFKLIQKSSKIGENKGNISYNYEQLMTINGKTTSFKEKFELPKQQVDSFEEQFTNNNLLTGSKGQSANNILSASAKKKKVKVDLPSLAPWGSKLLYNNVKYSNILSTAGILIAIAAYFKLTTAATKASVVYAVAQAIPGYFNIDPNEIYIDFFFALGFPMNLYVEVDYYYKYV